MNGEIVQGKLPEITIDVIKPIHISCLLPLKNDKQEVFFLLVRIPDRRNQTDSMGLVSVGRALIPQDDKPETLLGISWVKQRFPILIDQYCETTYVGPMR